MAADENKIRYEDPRELNSEEDLPEGWEVRTMDDGRIYYAHHAMQITQWEHPKSGKRYKVSGDLPHGWQKQHDSKGNLFFFDAVNRRTTYADPRLAQSFTKDRDNSKKLDSYSTATHVLSGEDLSGRVAVVTGSNSGIGFETAKALALHGAHVILACRDMKKANKAATMIRAGQTPEPYVETVLLDLASFASIRGFAEEFRQRKLPLHVLICNAAVFGMAWKKTSDGVESTFGVNHLGHFYLVKLLQDVLCSSAPARVVVLSSESHRFPALSYSKKLSLSDVPLSKDKYWSVVAYNQSKLCNLLFSMELNRRLKPKGVTCNAVHPGNLIYTSLSKTSWLYWLLFVMAKPFAKTPAQGAATVVYCATSKELNRVGGHYFNNCSVCDPSEEARNTDTAAKLWQLSEQLVRQITNNQEPFKS
ncbi:WW domain-containing oxidoreductase-like isoform X1 [Montipora capricornis]|uniref:WW domain-containing oxidoreductase-like isoform X1 n=1 Tax=Montipora capricornis TaxID=246305 RepID=UPI0035F17275